MTLVSLCNSGFAQQSGGVPTSRALTSYLPDDGCVAVAVIDVQKTMQSELVSNLKSLLGATESISLPIENIALSDIDQILLAFTTNPRRQPPDTLLIIRTKTPIQNDEPRQRARKLDASTLAFHGKAKILAGLGKTQTKDRWSRLLNVNADASIRLAIKPDLLEMLAIKLGPSTPAFAFEPLWTDVSVIAGGITLDDSPGIALTLGATDTEKVSETISAAKCLLGNYFDSLPRQLGLFGGPPPQGEKIVNAMVDLGTQLLTNIVVKSAGNRVEVHSRLSDQAHEIAVAMLPDFIVAQLRARPAKVTSNMKQLLLAIHNYESAYKRLPSSVIKRTEANKPHSWRVAILPFIDQFPLYQRYKFDEPWDSPANLEVMKEMPAVFAVSGDVGTHKTPYQILLSEDGALNPTKSGRGSRFMEIVDGTSNTAMLIKAKPLVPWTQPVDYQAPGKPPLDDIVGDSDRGLMIGMADGSVRYLTETITAEVWQALLTRAGGERVALP